MNKKQIYCSVKEFIGDNRLRAYASTLKPDRDSEIILPDAYLEYKGSFMKNPVLLKFHDYWSESVGKITMLEHDDFGIIIEIEFAPTDEGRKFATLYKGGFMNAFSIGFIPKKTILPDSEEVVGLMDRFGINKSSVLRIYKSIELLEVSCVPVPSNREAIVLQAKSFCGGNSNELDEIITDLKSLKEQIVEESNSQEKVTEEKDAEDVGNIKEKFTEDTSCADEKANESNTDLKEKSDAAIGDIQESKCEDANIPDAEVKDAEVKDAEVLVDMLIDKIRINIEKSIDNRFENFVTDVFGHFDRAFEDLSTFIDKEFKVFYGSTIGKKQESIKNDEQRVFEVILGELKKLK